MDRRARKTSRSSSGSTPPACTSSPGCPRSIWRRPAARDAPRHDVYRAGMIQHDEEMGQILKRLDAMGIADDTIVIYSTDNGYELMFWPDGGYSPFRGEKGTTWEGGVRVPMMVRWPGKIPAGSVSNAIQSHEDLFVTLAAAAGEPDIKDKLLQGAEMGGMSYKVHLDGDDNLDLWTGKTDKSARRRIFLLRRGDSHRRARGRLEDAVRGQGERAVVGPNRLSVGALSLQLAYGPHGALRSPFPTNGAIWVASS